MKRISILALILCACLVSVVWGQQPAGDTNFGPLSVPGTSVIFDPDHVLSHHQLAKLGSNGSLGATPAVQALTFNAEANQTFTFSASGLIGCCGTANIGPDGYRENSNIDKLKSISGFRAPRAVPLVGVFTDGKPKGAAPPDYNYKKGVGQLTFSPRLNQVFFIGDGLTGTGKGSTQTFNVPPTATELWLGFADAGGFHGPPGDYGDNPGSLTVSGTLSTPAQ